MLAQNHRQKSNHAPSIEVSKAIVRVTAKPAAKVPTSLVIIALPSPNPYFSMYLRVWKIH